MSIAVVEDEPRTEKPRFLHLVEAPKLPYPISPFAWTNEKINAAWMRMCEYPYMLSDAAKHQLQTVLRGTQAKQIHWFNLGEGHGLVHVYGISEDRVGTVNVEWLSPKRSFFRTFGNSKECRELWVGAVMRWLKLRKLRAYVAEPNKDAWKFAERCGFKLEGVLRGEWIMNGAPVDLRVYGITKQEVM